MWVSVTILPVGIDCVDDMRRVVGGIVVLRGYRICVRRSSMGKNIGSGGFFGAWGCHCGVETFYIAGEVVRRTKKCDFFGGVSVMVVADKGFEGRVGTWTLHSERYYCGNCGM